MCAGRDDGAGPKKTTCLKLWAALLGLAGREGRRFLHDNGALTSWAWWWSGVGTSQAVPWKDVPGLLSVHQTPREIPGCVGPAWGLLMCE